MGISVIHFYSYWDNIAANVDGVIMGFFHLHNYIIILSGITVSILYRKRMVYLITIIVNIDNILSRFGKVELDYEKSRKLLFWYLVLWCIYRFFNWLAGEIAAYFDGIDISRYRLYTITSIFNAGTSFLMLFIVAELKLRLSKVHKIGNVLMTTHFHRKLVLKFVKQMHITTTTLAKKINSIFELPLLIEIVTNTIFTIFGCFWASSGKQNYSSYAGCALWALFAVLHVVVIKYFCSAFSDENSWGGGSDTRPLDTTPNSLYGHNAQFALWTQRPIRFMDTTPNLDISPTSLFSHNAQLGDIAHFDSWTQRPTWTHRPPTLKRLITKVRCYSIYHGHIAQFALWTQRPIRFMDTTPNSLYGHNAQFALWTQRPIRFMDTTPNSLYGHNAQFALWTQRPAWTHCPLS
ncbi:hypothetical protein FQR65_LT16176 [Abscondita terminalis]|nr:hypothetical protein FQR65_LT16176 [Abscondita terminalis]